MSWFVTRSPRNAGAASRNANQWASASPTAVPHRIARSWPPTAPLTRPWEKWLSGSAASSAISTTDTYKIMIVVSRMISERASFAGAMSTILDAAIGTACRMAFVAPKQRLLEKLLNAPMPNHRSLTAFTGIVGMTGPSILDEASPSA